MIPTDRRGNKILTIALATILSFLPAAFAKPLFQRFIISKKKGDKNSSEVGNKIVLSMLFAISAALTSLLLPLKSYSAIALGIVYFTLWVLFFVIEAALEHWFIALAAKEDLNGAKKLSSISTAVIQVSVIAGPLLVALIKEFNSSAFAPFGMIALILGYGSFSSLVSIVPATAKKKGTSLTEANATDVCQSRQTQ